MKLIFSEKFEIWRYLISKSSKNCPNRGFWPFSLILHIMIGGHGVLLFSYNSLAQSMYCCSIFLFTLSQTMYLYFQQPARIHHGPPPDSYMFFSILTCLCCCWPLGIVAILKSGEVSFLLSV